MCCTQLSGNTGHKNDAKNRHLGTIAQLCPAVSLQLRHVSTVGKKHLLGSNTSSTCPRNMVNFGPLTAEIGSGVWGTLANFNGFRVLAALLHGSLVVGVCQSAALNRGHHLYSAGRLSRWALALAHILVCCSCLVRPRSKRDQYFDFAKAKIKTQWHNYMRHSEAIASGRQAAGGALG